MLHSVFAGALLIACLAQIPAEAQEAAAPGTRISLAGEVQAPGRYKLAVAYRPGAGAPEVAALLVTTTPSRRVLLVQTNDEALERSFAAEQPLAITTGPIDSHPMLILPYDPAADERIVVQLVTAKGDRLTVIDGGVDLTEFQVESRIAWDETGAPSKIEHCCSGVRPNCEKKCTTCSGPWFCCDLAHCTITCC